jgi:hypothetical protein
MTKDIVVLFIILFILYLINHFLLYNDVFYLTSKYNFVNENGYSVSKIFDEVNEQYSAYKYIEKNDIVLELGGRYGVVSGVINSILDNKENHVVIDPDDKIIDALTKNRNNNKFKYHILNKYIANNNKQIIYDGYATRLIENNTLSDNDDKKISYEEFKKSYPLKFNVLVADCEGCLCEFIKMIGNDINLYNKILFEADCKDTCNYTELINLLITNGFKMVENNFNFTYVFIK